MKLFFITTNTPKLQNSMKQFLQQQQHSQSTIFYETVFITTNTPKLQNSMKLFL